MNANIRKPSETVQTHRLRQYLPWENLGQDSAWCSKSGVHGYGRGVWRTRTLIEKPSDRIVFRCGQRCRLQTESNTKYRISYFNQNRQLLAERDTEHVSNRFVLVDFIGLNN